MYPPLPPFGFHEFPYCLPQFSCPGARLAQFPPEYHRDRARSCAISSDVSKPSHVTLLSSHGLDDRVRDDRLEGRRPPLLCAPGALTALLGAHCPTLKDSVGELTGGGMTPQLIQHQLGQLGFGSMQ